MPAAATIRMKMVALRSSERVRMCGVMGAQPRHCERAPHSLPSSPPASVWRPSCFHRAALEREQAAWAFLDKQDDQHQDRDLAEHGPGDRLQKLIRDAE